MLALGSSFEPGTPESQTPFVTHSGGQRANHSAMTHPSKRIGITQDRNDYVCLFRQAIGPLLFSVDDQVWRAPPNQFCYIAYSRM